MKNNTISTELPYFNDDLYMGVEEFISHIEMLVKEKRYIHIILGDYYEVFYCNVNRVNVRREDEGYNCVDIDFMMDDEYVGGIVLPKNKIYKKNPCDEYLEILEGFDYTNDPKKMFGEEIRVH